MSALFDRKQPQWLDEAWFPYRKRFLPSLGHTVHYVDEGRGPVLLMLHGNPGWSFQYRGMIHALRGRFRCIALDYPGFGLSEASEGYGFSAAEHARIVADLVEQLGLREVTLLAHDWGLPIGLMAACERPSRYRALVSIHGWLRPREANELSDVARQLAQDTLGGLLSRHFKLYSDRVLPPQQLQPGRRAIELEHYLGPHADGRSMERVHRLYTELHRADALRDLQGRLRALSHLPVLIMRGRGDDAPTATDARLLQRFFPQHVSRSHDHEGHYMVEAMDDALGAAVVDFRRREPALHGQRWSQN